MANDIQNITEFTKSDFLETNVPYEVVYSHIDNRFDLERSIEKMSDVARDVGVKNFKTLFKAYCRKMKESTNQMYLENITNFSDQPLELVSGQWNADDYGVSMDGPFGEIVACVHPIMPVKRLVNVDGGVEKLEVAFRKGGVWRKAIFDRKQLASSNSIVPALSDCGVAVTSESAKYLVQYMHDVENRNYDKIPESMSVTRLGWIGEYGFSPYVDNLIFDGDMSFKHRFDSVKQKGSFDKWKRAVGEIRKSGNVPAKILLASSFASVLVEPCNCLPFFVHLYGGTGTGKTVGMMLTASAWADPEMGRYIQTFNSTAVAQELSASFVNSMPLILDELQIVKDKKDFDQMIYQLSEGVGRARGQKQGGLQRTTTWHNCIITSGEQPLSNSNSGGGAINRIIEISCDDVNLFEEPGKLVDTLKKNYGHAGKAFIETLSEPGNLEIARDMQAHFYSQVIRSDVTEKQALAASLILTADALIDGSIFHDDQCLSVEDVSGFLSTNAEVSIHTRAYEWLQGWIAQNRFRFNELNSETGECWGKQTIDRTFININVFRKACMDNGFHPKEFQKWLGRQNLIDHNSSTGRYTTGTTVNGHKGEYVALRQVEFAEEFADFDEIP